MAATKKSSEAAVKKSSAKKAPAKKSAAKKTAATKAPAKKTPSKKAPAGRKYSPASSASVEREMKAMKEGKLYSSSGDKVTNPKQAIAIGLSEARREGDEMPPAPATSPAAGKKTASKKSKS